MSQPCWHTLMQTLLSGNQRVRTIFIIIIKIYRDYFMGRVYIWDFVDVLLCKHSCQAIRACILSYYIKIYRDYFMRRVRVWDFGTSWWCISIRNWTSECSEWVRFLIQTMSMKIPNKCPAHEVICLFYTYWVNISSLYLEKMTSEFKKQGPAQTKCPKKCIICWALQMLWVKILTKNPLKMKYSLLTQSHH